MKAAICTRYGTPDVIEIHDVAMPSPKENEVLIEIRAAAINSSDRRIRSFDMPRGMGLLARLALGITKPRQPILGNDLAGIVHSVGYAVTKFKPGDKIITALGDATGAHAQYIAIPQTDVIARKPHNLNMPQSASVIFGGLTALSFLRDKAKLQPGEHVLINGASGAVGCAAIQIAKALGAKVTAVCSSRNIDLVISLGADETINYEKEDVSLTGNKYDVIMDNVGNFPWKKAQYSLNETGRLLGVAAGLTEMIRALFVSRKNGKRYCVGMTETSQDIISSLIECVEEGALRPVIDRIYPFDEIVEAYSYVDLKRKSGSVVVVFDPI